MAKYVEKRVQVEAVTFEEFVEYGKTQVDQETQLVNGLNWSFEFRGITVTHESDICYLIPCKSGIYYFYRFADKRS